MTLKSTPVIVIGGVGRHGREIVARCQQRGAPDIRVPLVTNSGLVDARGIRKLFACYRHLDQAGREVRAVRR